MSSESHPPVDLLVVGHVTLDLVEGRSLPGGAAYYAARAASGLGLRVGVVTSWGVDFSHRSALAGLSVAVRPAAQSTCFENRYRATGRQQRLCGLAEPLGIEDIPETWRSAPALYLCPVMGEVSLDLSASLPGMVALGAQGWMRRVGPQGRVLSQVWRPSMASLERVRMVVLSDEDAAGDPGIVSHLAERVSLVAYTHGERGCELFEKGTRHWVEAHPADEVDPTGAGDVFGVVLLAALSRGWSSVQAARLAAAAASVVVEGRAGQALDRIDEAWRRLSLLQRMAGDDGLPAW